MPTPILATKLYVPRPQPEIVSRSRLVERLYEGLHSRLTLICAPAGFGKTTVLGEFLGAIPWPAAWLSLDEEDSDPARFLAYLVAALRTIAVDIGEDALGVLESPQPPTETVLTALLNEIDAIDEDFVLVLDDYHVIDAGAVDDALSFVVEHLPLRMHLVISTREDPRLPLARLRAGGQLTELRAADLRFTTDEAAEFLGGAMGLDLSAGDVLALETRTEGWIAGLQLAALSLRGREDVPGFIRAFAGDNRYIVDYLVEEVLQRQPEHIRSFLLETSILDRLSGPLCDAVTGQEGGSARLEFLERGNLFVVPLDDRRLWYRYHHLFAQVLFARLLAEETDRVAALHRRASGWYERNGLSADAIRHALAAEDFERAAELVELADSEMRRGRQEGTLLAWLEAIPDELIRSRPVLSVGYAGVLLSTGKVEGVEDRLRDAERWLDTMADVRDRPDALSTRMVVADENEYRRLPGSIAMYRAGLALALGDVSGTAKYARQVLDLATEDDHLLRGAAAALLGLAFWTSGDLEAAHQSYADGMASLQRAGNISDVVGGSLALADIRIVQGRLREAMRTYEQALEIATEHGDPAMRGTADMYVGMSEIHRERGDLEAATRHLLKSKEQGEHTGFPQNPYRWCVAMALLREARGDPDGALDLLCEAERLYVSDFFPDVRPVAALRTRVWVRQGRLDEALGWAREQGLSTYDDLSYLREFEHITLARVLLAAYGSGREEHPDETLGLLERLLEAAEESKRTGRVIEILVLRALAHEAQGDRPSALVSLERALTLAEPEGYVRVFVDEGKLMARLLADAAAFGVTSGYKTRLLAVLEAEQRGSGGKPPVPDSPASRSLVEPLSDRETEVLHLIALGLSNREISERLFLAVITVKGHNRNIFRKLQVRRRTEAVARARELGLL
ncbi:MAG TPA: LuxR C-terminal-related transcriptional regulator [Rubrobacter sp.]|nr:LuxR C-terminal-related transcriptional regulator [Rubrobacter sp.]